MGSWVFSSEELARLRSKVVTEAGSPLTPDEEARMAHCFARKIYERLPRFPGKVIPAAALYLQRFYLRVSAATVSPRDLMLAVLFLSNKLNNTHHVPIDFNRIIQAWGVTAPPSALYDLENTLLDALRFDVDATTPHEKFVALVQDVFPELTAAFKTAALDRDYTNTLLDRATATDAVLMFTPGEVAIAVLELVLKQRAERLKDKFSQSPPQRTSAPGGTLDCNSPDIVEQFNRALPTRIKKFSEESRAKSERIQAMVLEGLADIPRPWVAEMEHKLRCFKDGVPYTPLSAQHAQHTKPSVSPVSFVPSRPQSASVPSESPSSPPSLPTPPPSIAETEKEAPATSPLKRAYNCDCGGDVSKEPVPPKKKDV